MKNFLTISGKLSVLSVCILFLTASVLAQVTLRRALDTDMDGKADFTVFRPSNNIWYTLKSNGSGFTAQQFGTSNTDYPTPGDFDGDNQGDIAVWRDTDGYWYRLNSSNNTFSAAQFGTTGDEPIARDYDGDGKTDIAVVRRSNGKMFWYSIDSQTGAFRGSQFGLTSDFTAPGDYDGDGKFDLAVQRPGATPTSQGTFYILQSMTGGLRVAPYGFSSDLVVPGDYDGDGKTDLAVVREGSTPTSNLFWFINRSTDNQVLVYSFGITGTDLNVQGDYDGDGKTDVAVWRDTNGLFLLSEKHRRRICRSSMGKLQRFSGRQLRHTLICASNGQSKRLKAQTVFNLFVYLFEL